MSYMNWQINYSLKDLLRIVTIVCGYLLIRAYLQKWIKSKQTRDYEAEDNNNKSSKKATSGLNTIIENDLEEETLVWGAVRRKEQKMKSIE
ncbi:hypothetical protein T552_00651 [Pneumocystis carinii B80]|uniref:Uncharacterized protein n=1 Tax=Pneumocystis carinii (strain B80) TaxID=1408658 RepID=A0A0W4ZP73_PNEC8|nr:hypothetical protein T552_00651 [Pneumocystis carinii B80]KTW30174.1 hypothetical protein T552_00651 [Pneumocystis carinii B80]